MLIRAHCFLENAQISQPFVKFDFDNKKVLLTNVRNSKGINKGMVLKVTEKADIKEFILDSDSKEDTNKILNIKLNEYSTILQDVAQLVEGLLSVHHNSSVPSFQTNIVNANLLAEDPKEEELLKKKGIMRAFGIVSKKEKGKEFQVEEEIFSDIPKAQQHLAALSCFSQAIRFHETGYQEIAFLLYFRIVEGYFSDGSKNVSKALKQNSDEVKTYLKIDDKLVNSLKIILENILELPSKSDKGIDGILDDIILLRHKMIHFDASHYKHHYNPKLKFELGIINNRLKMATLGYLQTQLR